jgi:hypothetical protein
MDSIHHPTVYYLVTLTRQLLIAEADAADRFRAWARARLVAPDAR